MTKWVKTRAVPAGSVIGVLSASSALEPERFAAGVSELQALGYRVSCPLDPSTNYGSRNFVSAPAAERAQALETLLRDDEVRCIIAVRGGYGALELLPLIDFDLVAWARKPIVGYSDITALLLATLGRARITCVHGPVIGREFAQSSSNEEAKASVSSLLALLSEPDYRAAYSCSVLREGAGEGPLVGGNLAMLCTLLGTPWDMNYDGAVLFLEDVSEAPYRVRRTLVQLKLAGKLDRLSGLVFGRFSRCEANQGPCVEEVLRGAVEDLLGDTRYPVLADLAVGHDGLNLAVPLGCRAAVRDGTLEVLESPVTFDEER